MKWTVKSFSTGPSLRELGQELEAWLEELGYAVIDRSGWMKHGSHIWLLTGRVPEEVGPPVRTVSMIRTQYVRNALNQVNCYMVDESEDPEEEDCPMRLIRGLDGHPPVNAVAREWRERVVRRHTESRPGKAVLRTLRKNYPNGEKRLALRTGETAVYCQGRYRKRNNVSAYTVPGSGRGVRLLRPESIDPAATLALWGMNPAGKRMPL